MLDFMVFAVEHSADHGNKTAFYVAGGALAVWAVLVGGFGVLRPAFAQGEATGRAVVGLTLLLAAATLVAAVATAS